MSEQAKQKCETCRFWSQETYSQSKTGEREVEPYRFFDTLGVCRRSAPGSVFLGDMPTLGYGYIRWPLTTKLDWCGEWAEKKTARPSRPKPPLPTEWIVLEVANKLEAPSKIEFREVVERRHVRSSRGVALWVCELANKSHGVNLRDGHIAVSVRIDDGGFSPGVVEHLEFEGVLVVEYAKCWTGDEKWVRVVEVFGLDPRGPREHLQSLKDRIISGELQLTPNIAEHLKWVESWMKLHDWEQWEEWQSIEQAKLDKLNESLSGGKSQ